MKTIFTFLAILALVLPAAAIQTVLLPGSIADANENGQADIDLSSLKGTAAFVLTAKSIAGTTPTAAVKLQSSPPPATGAAMRTGTTAGVVLRSGTDTAIKLGASFTTPAAYVPTVKAVMLPLKKHATLLAGTLTVTISTDSSGPSAVLATGTLDAANLTASFTGQTVTFAKGAQLAASTKYWVTLEGDYTVDATANVTWLTTTVSSGGNGSIFGTGWVASGTNNLNFQTSDLVFTDVTGGGFTTVTTTGSLQQLTIPIQNFGSHFRAFATITGTNTPEYIIGIAAYQKTP
jgi:hypothetical protein